MSDVTAEVPAHLSRQQVKRIVDAFIDEVTERCMNDLQYLQELIDEHLVPKMMVEQMLDELAVAHGPGELPARLGFDPDTGQPFDWQDIKAHIELCVEGENDQ